MSRSPDLVIFMLTTTHTTDYSLLHMRVWGNYSNTAADVIGSCRTIYIIEYVCANLRKTQYTQFITLNIIFTLIVYTKAYCIYVASLCCQKAKV